MAPAVAPPARPAVDAAAWQGRLVLDTNVVLDLLVFDDPGVRPLRLALDAGTVEWIASSAMRDELERVLAYPRIQPPLLARGRTPADVLAQFDQLTRAVDAPPAATVRCSDPDDQIFVDLAVACRATLFSKDMAVLRLRARLAALGVRVLPV